MTLADKLARVVGGDDPEERYECKRCEERFLLDRQTCPACGGCTIDRIEWRSSLSE
ncbi:MULTISPECIES: hypothetical protein [Halorussus]|uniref:hypothetical protein n=1 Tax=Halorussus TaxID=1070314 RepID=UPI0020A0CFC0|nr:hypothetical protein [Halorussus vallis]USZ75789.1 hypothetical protein NGM07_00325 [Halorussus vallis]